MTSGVTEIDPEGVRDLGPDVLGDDGRLRVLPAAFWATTTAEERALFGHRNGIYSFPTVELVEHLRELIDDRKAIEIGAGNGVLAEALAILATDSRQQEMPEYRATYRAIRQPTVPYGPNIIECEASRAVRKYRPQVVIGCWVTHKYDRRRHSAGGNEVGIDEGYIIDNCDTYVVVGNQQVHAQKPIWKRDHTVINPEWLYSRAHNGTPEFIAVWSR